MDLETLTLTLPMTSMSKSVASVAALVLVEKHGIDLDSNYALSAVLQALKLGDGE